MPTGERLSADEYRERADRVAEMYQSGCPVGEILDAVGCSREYVHKIRMKRGIPAQHPGRISMADVRRDAAARYLSGQSADTIARELDVGITTVYRALTREGIEFRRKPTRSDVLNGHAEEIIEKYLAGRSCESIGADYGASGGGIRSVLLRNGVERRSPARAVVTFSPEDQALIIEMRDAGGRVRDIAAAVGRADVVVTRFLNEVGRGGKARKPKTIASNGYVLVRDDDGQYVLEHRHVMAKMLGRELLSTETVHHIDGDPANNNPTNLQIRHGAHGKGVVMVCHSCGSHDVRAVEIATTPRTP